MQFRFLYLNAEGVETKVSTLDELAERVRGGAVTEDTVLYDAETREWGPARAHGAWRSILAEYDDVGGEAEEPASGDVAAGDELSPGPDPLADPRAGTPPATRLTLAPDFLDDEAAVAAFVAARERERREEAQRRGSDLPPPDVVRERTLVPGRPADEASDGPDTGAPPPPRSAAVHQETVVGEPARPGAEGGEAARTDLPTGPTRAGMRRRRRRIVNRAVTVGVAVLALVLVRAWTGGGEADADDVAAGDEGVPGVPPPVDDEDLATVLAEVEGSAFESMVVAMDSLRSVFGVEAPPEGWLEGHYLANASSYDRVPAYWQRYETYVQELRLRDEEYFRQGYVARLAAAGLTGPVASIRLARAMADFDEEAPARDSIYTAMEGVAGAALSLHELLVERESRITWTPVRPGFVTRDPILEAVPDDEELRRELNERLDLLLDRMDVVRGGLPGSSAELGAAALTSLRTTRSDEGPPGGGGG
jgi:hypothetical protein